MNSKKKYLSLSLLILFLFPQIGKDVHVFLHHCHETMEYHGSGVYFENHEHACPICDFNFSISHNTTQYKFDVFLPVNLAEFLDNSSVIPFLSLPAHFSPRAPPVV